MSSQYRGSEDSIAVIHRVATQLGFSTWDAEQFSFALQKYPSCESLGRITEEEAFELSLPPILVRAVKNEICAARFEKPVMRCVVQPPLEVPNHRDVEVCSDTSSRPTEVCQCKGPGPLVESSQVFQGASTPQSQLTISPRSLCEDPPGGEKSEWRPSKADLGQPGKPLQELQRRAASLEVPPASQLRGAKVGCGGVRPPSSSSTTFPSNTSTSSSSSSAVTGPGKHPRRIITAVTRLTPRCRAPGREEGLVKKAAASSPRSAVALRTISQSTTSLRPQGGSMYVPPARRSDGRLEASPVRTFSPRGKLVEQKAAASPSAAKALRQDIPWTHSGPASAECPVGGASRFRRMESPDRKAYSRRPGASREDTRAVSPVSQKVEKSKIQEEPATAASWRKGSSLTLGTAGSALNLSCSNTVLLESPRDLQKLQMPCQSCKMICRTEAAPLSARLPRAAGAHSIELPPGHRGTQVAQVVVRPALTTGVVLGLCHAPAPVSSPVVGATHPYPGVRSWQPRAF